MPKRNRLYDIWHGAKRRTSDPRRKDYCHYGAVGIKMCDEWMNSYEAFEKWSLSHGYKEGMTLDRICRNRGYDPNNCRWITTKQQAYNRNTGRYITINGHTKTLEEWSKIKSIGPDVIIHRVKNGWTWEEAVTTPLNERRKKKDESISKTQM